MSHKTPTKSRPGWRSQRRPGLADQKDTDRLMDIESRTSDTRPPRTSICPKCGLGPTNTPTPRTINDDPEGVVTAYYVCALEHLWAVRWDEVA